MDSTWSGGIYATPTLAGSRSGKDIAGTWATMLYIGKDGYIQYANKIIQLVQKLKIIIRNIPELRLLSDVEVMVIAFTTKDSAINIYNIKNEMSKLGWYLSSLQNPNGIHFCVTAVHTEINNFASMFEHDLKSSISNVKNNPSNKSSEAIMYW